MNLKKDQMALSNYPYYKHSFNYTLDSLQRLGAEAIELYCCYPHFHIDDAGLPQVTALKKNLQIRSMHPICLTPEQGKYPINIAAEDPIARNRSIQTYIKCIQYASELECPTVQFHAGYNLLDCNYSKTWHRSVDSLNHLTDIAEGYGVTIIMEAAHKLATILNSSNHIVKMVNEINSPNLRGMIDTLCLAHCSEDIHTALKNIGSDSVHHIHFSDCLTSHPKNHLIPGEGDMDLEEILQTLDKINYQGYITIEIKTPYEYNPEEAMRKSAEWLRTRLAG